MLADLIFKRGRFICVGLALAASSLGLTQSFSITALPAAENTEAFDSFTSASSGGAVVGAETFNVNPAVYSSGSGWSLLPYSAEYDTDAAPNGAVTSVSEDGTVEAGFTYGSIDGVPGYSNAYWIGVGQENLIPLPAGMSNFNVNNGPLSTSLSGDGTTILESTTADGSGPVAAGDYAVIFNIATGISTNIGSLNLVGPSTFGTVIDYDGGVISGLSENAAGTGYDMFVWTSLNGMLDVTAPAAFPSASQIVPTCINKSGSIIYGTFYDPATGYHGFKWTAGAGLVPISSFYPTSCTADGAVVVGLDPTQTTCVIYTAKIGAQYVSNFLSGNGVDVSQWSFPYYSDPVISGNGTKIFCSGDNTSTGYSNVQIGLPAELSSVTLLPISISGGLSSTGTVNLSAPAPSGGLTVSLASQLPTYVSVAPSITIPAGASSATFAITTKTFRQNYTSSVTATLLYTSQSATLNVVDDSVASVNFSPDTVLGGGTSTGTVTLLQAAPNGGWKVNLSSQMPSYVSVPSSIVIPAGSMAGVFTATTSIFRRTYSDRIVATDATSSVTGTLTVVGDSIANLTLSPASLMGGNSSVGTITLAQAAPAGGWMIGLSSQIPSYVGVPSSITIPAGSTSAHFNISTKPFRQTYTNVISATDATSTQSSTLTVVGDSVASLTLSPSMVVGGEGSTGTVSLLSPAPAGGWTVNLASQIPSYVGVPPSISVAAGATTATFAITTKSFRQAYSSSITASDAVSTRSATLSITTG